MADTVQTLSLLTLAQNYRGKIVGQVNRMATGLRLLPWVLGEGKNCAWVVGNTGMITENYSEGADASNFGSDAQAEAILSWGHYRSNFHVSGLAAAAAKRSATPDGAQNLLARNLVQACASLASSLNARMYDGAGTGTTIAGLGVAIADTTNTYATIDRGAQSYWQPNVSDPGVATAPTFAQIRSDMSAIYTDCGFAPDVAVCHPNVFNKLGSLFDSTRHYIYDISTARGPVHLDAGLGAMEVDGMFLIKDKDCQDNRIYYLNTGFAHWEYLPPSDPEVFEAVRGFDMQADDGFGMTPLGCQIEQLSKGGDSTRFQVRTYAQLVVTRPNAFGCRLNVATS